jgi:hypothetical protein
MGVNNFGGQIFKPLLQDTCVKKFLLVSMGGLSRGSSVRTAQTRERGPPLAPAEIIFLQLNKVSLRVW